MSCQESERDSGGGSGDGEEDADMRVKLDHVLLGRRRGRVVLVLVRMMMCEGSLSMSGKEERQCE